MNIIARNGSWNIKAVVYEKAGSVNINNNTSVVRVDLYVGRNSGAGSSYIYGGFSGSITVNGYAQSYSGSTNGSQTIADGGYWYTGITKDTLVTHNADGSKTVGVSFSWSANFSPSSASGSGNLTLSTIARKTTCPSLTGYIKTSYNLTLSPKSTSFTHSLKVTFGSITGWLQSDGTLGNSEYKFSTRSPLITIPSSFYNEFNGYEANGTLYLYTYNGNTNLGYNTSTLRVQCNPIYKPEIISYNIIDINNTTLALTGDQNSIIKNASTAYITLTMTQGDFDDPLSNITTSTINGTVFTGNTITIMNANTLDYTISLTNNRNANLTTIISATGNLIDYLLPTINISSIKRPGPTSSAIDVSYDGIYYIGYFDEEETEANTLTISWDYKEKESSTWITGGVLTPTLDTSNNTYSGNETLGNNFDYQKQYDFRFIMSDRINTITLNRSVSRGFPIFWWTNDSLRLLADLYINENKVEDYCIEQDTSGIWEYKIYASGKVECWGYQELTGADTGSTWGGFYVFDGMFGGETYPVVFDDVPIELVTITKSNNACFSYHESYNYGGGSNTTTTSGYYSIAKPGGPFSQQTIGVSFYVRGVLANNTSL